MPRKTPTQRRDTAERPAPRLGKARARFGATVTIIAVVAFALGYGVANASAGHPDVPEAAAEEIVEPTPVIEEEPATEPGAEEEAVAEEPAEETSDEPEAEEPIAAEETPAPLSITDMTAAAFDQGTKPAEHTKYILLHDTQLEGDAESVVNSWLANSDRGVASHFVIDRDGSVIQCVGMDRIAFHAGRGDDDNYERYGVGDSMNAWSIGIELCHVAGEEYPEAQLDALDQLIAKVDDWAGTPLEIIDHKMWRSTNTDTSAEFSGYLAQYRETRTHEV